MVVIALRCRRLAASLVLAGVALAGCGSLGGDSDWARRQDMVTVPADASPVGPVRWSQVGGLDPLNRRMILLEVRRRPHLLVLARPCAGLQRNSVLVTGSRSGKFDPRSDAIGVVNLGRGGIASTCIPDTLYAIQEEDVEALRAMF
ncbi:MAG: DUF6491 family protein [Pseudomonadota bacterium]